MHLEGHFINLGSCHTLCNACGRWLLLVLQGLSTGETAETAAINSMLSVVANQLISVHPRMHRDIQDRMQYPERFDAATNWR